MAKEKPKSKIKASSAPKKAVAKKTTKIVSKVSLKVAPKAAVKAKPVIKAKTIVTKAKPKVAEKVKVAPKVTAAVKPSVKTAVVKKEAKDHKTETKTQPQAKVVAKTAAVKTETIKPAAVAKTTKPETASKAKTKAKKVEKKESDGFDDDLVLDDDFGDSEISDYEDDLKIVEDDDTDDTLEISDDDDEEVKDEEIYLTDSEGRRLCRVRDCDQVSVVEGYCRYHYLLLWKKIQIRKAILLDGKLEKYIMDLTSRFPDKFVDMIKKDMKSEKEFLSAIQELEIDESALNESDSDDEVQSFSDEIRGIGEAPSMDDDGDY